MREEVGMGVRERKGVHPMSDFNRLGRRDRAGGFSGCRLGLPAPAVSWEGGSPGIWIMSILIRKQTFVNKYLIQ